MDIGAGDTAIVITDPQNDFLSPDGVTWELVGANVKDNDTVAAIVGAAVGALHGREKIPDRWISNLSGRTTDQDDGKVFELITQAKKTFWSQERSNDH